MFGGAKGLRDASCASTCDNGLCSNEEIATGLCREGYFCEEGAVSPEATECGGSGKYRHVVVIF